MVQVLLESVLAEAKRKILFDILFEGFPDTGIQIDFSLVICLWVHLYRFDYVMDGLIGHSLFEIH